ncbi:MAG: LysM peptidoglycan-binding domain-containing protein [Deltaproteobacteria bacterium]|nr:LysM peptidoglycan-binding domain-containing protein [Deltaproteobacteria bacterium]MBW2444980.1 LysM peptidoglycan-binding domain-containing protein [Deltaproteobacteria bacterium]
MSRAIFVFSAILAIALGVMPPRAGADGPMGSQYVVKRGQTLSVIAHDALGDPELWPAIYRANRDQIKDPTVLHVGQRLSIPQVARAERARVRREAAAFTARGVTPKGPDVAAAPPGSSNSATE